MSPWRRLAPRNPLASNLTRASRSISDERSIPIALSARGAEQFDHPPGAGADIDQPPDRLARPARWRSPARLRFRRRGATGCCPTCRHGPRNSAPRPRRGRRAPPRAARRRPRTARAPRRCPIGRSRRTRASCARASASIRNTQLPSLRRTTSPLSARMRTWRDTRGWLCPSNCASSPTDSSIDRSSARMRSRLGSASAWKSAESGESVSIKQTYKDMFIWVNRKPRAALSFFCRK